MMKILYYTLFLLLGVQVAKAQGNKPESQPNSIPAAHTPIYPNNYSGSLILNFSREIVPRSPINTESQLSSARQLNQATEVTTYYDGFMRPLQVVQKRAVNITGRDFIYHYNYDNNGLISRDLLPFARSNADPNNDGKFNKNIQTDLLATYNQLGYAGESFFYNENIYENSLLRRPLASKGAGITWNSSNGVRINQRLATTSDNLLKFELTNLTSNSLPIVNPAGYNNDQITVIEKEDEDGYVTLTFIDEFETVIAEQKGSLRSYNIYDFYGRLRYVISPKAIESIIANGLVISNDIIDNLCFSYSYDAKDNVTMIKKPGVGAQYLKYDNMNRVILSQDAMQRQDNKWLFTKYDTKGRIVQQGFFSDNGSLTSTLNQGEVLLGNTTNSTYSSSTFLNYLLETKIYSVNDYLNSFAGVDFYLIYYYDNYEFINRLVTNNNYSTLNLSFVNQIGNSTEGYDKAIGNNSINNLTGMYVRTNNNNQWLARVNYYNKRGELIQTITENLNNSYSVIGFGYDFNGRMIKSVSQSQGVTIQKKYIHDVIGRLRFISHKIGASGDYRRIASFQYDAIGRLTSKVLGSIKYNVKYEYNIRNWITGINKEYTTNPDGQQFFGMELFYNTGYTSTYKNGRLAGIRWRTKGASKELRTYGYLYDNNQRLTMADYYYQDYDPTGANTNWVKDKNDFTTDNLNYDNNGNILSMRHMGLDAARNKIVLDDLEYEYDIRSNKLIKVTESNLSESKDPMLNDGLSDFRDGVAGSNDYMYDANGSLVADNNRNIRIDISNWYVINKPIESRRADNSDNKIKYIYDATGNLLRKVVSYRKTPSSQITINTTDYIGDMVLENNTLKLINHDEGRVLVTVQANNTNSYKYDYYLKDNIENIRCIISESPDEAVQGIGILDPSVYSPTEINPWVSPSLNAPPVGYLATSEYTNAIWEEELFERVGETRTSRPGVPVQGDYSSAELTATSGLVLGPGKLLRVLAGDKIELGVEAYYHSAANMSNPVPVSTLVYELVNAIQSAASVSGDVSTAFTQANLNGNQLSIALSTMQEHSTDTTLPSAFLNYLLFDDNFKLLQEESGLIQVEQSNNWQNLAVTQFPINQNGYLYVFTSNQSQISVRTDNLYIYHWKSRMLEEFNYYPFGLTFDVSISPDEDDCNIRYNSQRIEQNEFVDANEQKYGTNWYDFMARSYDMQIGRWLQPDPMMQHFSPYLAMSNNPTLNTDPTGLFDFNDPIKNGPEMRAHIVYAYPLRKAFYESSGLFNSVEANGGIFADAGGGSGLIEDDMVPTTFLSKNISLKWSNSVLSYIERVNQRSINERGVYGASERMKGKRAISGGGNVWNDVANGIGIAMGIKQEILGFSVAQNYKTARNPYAFARLRESQQAWRTTNTLGNFGKKVLTTTKVLGVATGVVQVAFKGVEIYNKGIENATARDWSDIVVNTSGVVAAVFFASNPMGWAIGAVALTYSIGTTIYDASTKP